MIVSVVIVIFMLLLLGTGFPIFLALGGAGAIGLFLAKGPMALALAATSFFGQLNSFEMIALPLFILMGHVLSKTPIGKDLFEVASKWLVRLPGGLAIASVGACTIFGAVSGVSIAGVAAVGSLAVPEMVKRGYDRKLAAGSVVTAGALSMLIPPSVPFIIYSAISGESVAKLFIGGIVPGLAIAFMLSALILVKVWLKPELAVSTADVSNTWRECLSSLKKIWHALLLILLVLGSIYTGIATPTEASAVGAAGAFLIAGFAYKTLNIRTVLAILRESLKVSAAILLIMGCARIFGDYLNIVRLPQTLTSFLLGLHLPNMIIMLTIMALLIVLGMFVDGVSLIVVTTPILLPLVTAMGYDPLWYGIILVINLELAVVTPPVGLNLYTLRGVCPFLSIEEIIQSSIPFLAVEVVVLIVFTLFPALSLWLPSFIR
ncbi:putative permease protein, TRAP-type dicarboxylate transporter, DctM subunit [Candidatus Vecturithrix granuli]|uniref:Putative permease protein, TRAP-type dicarboxylate transporter, DctM subunit n=1 Tax=Vecturithrix granuli TaxID=1499967 RepID=A0A081C2W5_VECG1|nr:putative permease protein, TRAP-type dicarboxylate transporter, DctM subunit [Candidatus Vecturithrix granuli]